MDDRHLTTLLEHTYPSAPVPPLERLEQRAAAIRRRRRTLRAASAVAAAAIVVLAVVATLPGVDRGSVQTPLRPAPTTTPDVSKTHADVSKTHAIAVTPSTGLQDGQIVRVSGRFAPPVAAEAGIGVWICRVGVTPPTAAYDCDGSTGQESSHATMPLDRYPYMVRRTITTLGGQSFDCAAAPGCVLYAATKDRVKGPVHSRYQNKYGVAPLAFDAVAPPLPGPSVTVTPHDGLRDGDTVTIRGDHFRPFAPPGGGLCVSGTEVCTRRSDIGWSRAGPDGSFSVTQRVWSVFSSRGTLEDCRTATCAIGVVVRDANIFVPVSFAPGTPASLPYLTLDPGGPYTDGQEVTVTLHGWSGAIGDRSGLAIENLTIRPCAPYLGDLVCADAAVLQGPDADGRYTATLALHRTLSAEAADPGNPADCTQPGNCQVALAFYLGAFMVGHIFTPILAADVVVT